MTELINMECPICFEHKRILIANSCGHAACKQCIRHFVRSIQYDHTKHPVICWASDCKEQLDKHSVIRKIFNKNQFRRFENLSKQLQISKCSFSRGHLHWHVLVSTELKSSKIAIQAEYSNIHLFWQVFERLFRTDTQNNCLGIVREQH